MHLALPFLLAAAFAGLQQRDAPAASPPPSREGLDQVEEILVTGTRRSLPPLLEPVEYWRRHCFEALRTGRRAEEPAEDSVWMPLDEGIRRRLRLADPAARAFGLHDRARGHTMVLTIEDAARPDRLSEQRCALILIGGTGHFNLRPQLARVLRGPGTERHVGFRGGPDPMPGWRQWLWTAMPARGSTDWRFGRTGAGAGAGDSFLVVTNLRFYDRHDYLMADLKTRADPARPLSILSFALVRR